MGYRGKLAEQQQARRLRRTGLPLAEIAATLGVSRSSVSLWVRDVEFVSVPRVTTGRRRAPNALQRRRQAVVHRLLEEGRVRVGRLSERGATIAYWSALTGIPPSQFGRPYRAVPDASIHHAKHVHGCVTVSYSCCATHRSVMGLVSALLSDSAIPG